MTDPTDIDGTETELERCKKLRAQAIDTAVERTQERDRARGERDAAARELVAVMHERDFWYDAAYRLVELTDPEQLKEMLGVDRAAVLCMAIEERANA